MLTELFDEQFHTLWHPRGIQSMPPEVPLAVDAALLLPVCDFKS
jgi:hypothetical protein